MDTFSRQFGLLIAYLLPGFIALAGIARLVPAVGQWLQPTAVEGGTGLGPPVYAILAATAIGMVLSCFRWLIIDHLHQWTGVRPPAWNVDRLEARLEAFNQLVEYHYRYYQFYANALIAVLLTYLLNRFDGGSTSLGIASDVGVVILCAVLFAGSRDALMKYYARTQQLIGQDTKNNSKGEAMTNGCHHDQAGRSTPKKSSEAKPKPKPETPKGESPKGKVVAPAN